MVSNNFSKLVKLQLLHIFRFLLNSPLSNILIFISVCSIRPYRQYDPSSNIKSILILNHERYEHDLKAISKNNDVRLLIFPSRIQTLINTIFLGNKYSYEVDSYLNKTKETEVLVSFVIKIINKINNKYELCGITSCSFYYRQDFPYEFASEITKIPYYVIFKEWMKDRSVIEATTKKYKLNKYKFVGKKIFCANQFISQILINSGVCDKNQISIIGSPRFDLILSEDIKYVETKPVITFFSFYHASGQIQLKGSDNFFSDDKNDGYYDLFDQVHNAIAQLACENENFQFIIKTKWGGSWHERITSSIKNISNLDINKISNLTLIQYGDAQTLIKKSAAIVAFNSTTILESCLLKKNVIIPIFAEAKSKYFNTNLLYKEYLSSLILATSKKDLMQKIIHYAQNQEIAPIPKQMVLDFIGYNDSQATQRFVNEILKENF